MRFVQKWSYACAKHLAYALNENHNKRSVYYYGFYVLFGTLVKAFILISLSLLLGIFIPALLTVIVLASLRLFAGGYHFDTYGKCLVVSMALTVATALISQYTHRYWSMAAIAIFLFFVFALSLYMLIKYAPKDTPTKPITAPADIIKFKRLSIVYLGILLILCCVLFVLGMKMYIMAVCFGVLLEVFSITPAGHSFFDIIKAGLNKG